MWTSIWRGLNMVHQWVKPWPWRMSPLAMPVMKP